MERNKSTVRFNALAVGWYGAPNVGDEVLLDVLKEQVQSLGGTLIAASVDPELTTRLHGIDAVDYNNLGEIARSLSWADVLIMGGGGIFQDHHPFGVGALYDPFMNDIAGYARPVLMARQFGVPVVIWGHGVGPLRSADARNIVRDIFESAAGVSVRDMSSLELLRDIGVSREVAVGPDPGWLYGDVCIDVEGKTLNATGDRSLKRLVVVVREWMLGSVAWKERLISALDKAVTDDWTVSWVAFQSRTGSSGAISDQGLFDEMRQRVRPGCRGEFFAPATPIEAWAILEGADAIFSMRLHASILGLLAGKPVAGLEYDEKMRNAHNLAEMPEAYRLGLDGSQARFDAALISLLKAESWKPDPAVIRKLKDRAGVHRQVLAACAVSRKEPQAWEAGKFDWMGTWLQQAVGDLRMARNVSVRAHKLLEFRDATLSQREAELAAKSVLVDELREDLKRVQDLFEYTNDQIASAEQVHSERMNELNEVRQLAGSQRSELVQLQEARDSALSQRDVELAAKAAEVEALRDELNRVQELFEFRSGQLAAAEQLQLERTNELSESRRLVEAQRDKLIEVQASAAQRLSEVQQLAESRRSELIETQASAAERMTEVLKERVLNDQLRAEQSRLNGELEELAKQLRSAELARLELADELKQKLAYIEDKEVHVAQLAFQLDQQGADLNQTTFELEQLKTKRRRLATFLLRIRRNASRVAASPFKFLSLWRRHGLRVATEQTHRRLSTLGRPSQSEDMESGGVQPKPPRPVRAERLLVVAGVLDEDGWPSRGVAFAKAAERAGFFVRIWHAAESAAPASAPGSLMVGRGELMQLVTEQGTRVFLTDHSDAALSFVAEAKDRGAEIVLDQASMRLDVVDDVRLHAFAQLTARITTRDGQLDPRLDGIEHEVLPDGGDNEIFDSYKEYPYPVNFRKRRKNILLFVEGVESSSVLERLATTFPEEQIHIIGDKTELPELPQGRRVHVLSARYEDLAPLLSAADTVLIHGRESGSWALRSFAMAALLMEKRVISSVRLDGIVSRNFRVLEPHDWGQAALSEKAVEDYEFVSHNAWLGRAEELMRAQFPLSVSVVVLIHNNRTIIERCISTILDHCQQWLHEIVVVDNQSVDGGAEFVEQRFGGHPKVQLVRNSENGCSSGRNLGVKSASGKFIAFFDSDQWVTSPSSFAEAVHLLEAEPALGAIGWNAGWFDATRNDLGGAISDYVPNRGMNAAALERGYRGDIGFLGTSGMFMRRELFERIDGFDTFYDPTCFEDTDICFQIKSAGFVVALRDLAGIRHQPHQTTGASEGSERYRKLFVRNAEYFRNKWSGHTDYFVDYTE